MARCLQSAHGQHRQGDGANLLGESKAAFRAQKRLMTRQRRREGRPKILILSEAGAAPRCGFGAACRTQDWGLSPVTVKVFSALQQAGQGLGGALQTSEGYSGREKTIGPVAWNHWLIHCRPRCGIGQGCRAGCRARDL